MANKPAKSFLGRVNDAKGRGSVQGRLPIKSAKTFASVLKDPMGTSQVQGAASQSQGLADFIKTLGVSDMNGGSVNPYLSIMRGTSDMLDEDRSQNLRQLIEQMQRTSSKALMDQFRIRSTKGFVPGPQMEQAPDYAAVANSIAQLVQLYNNRRTPESTSKPTGSAYASNSGTSNYSA